MVNIEKKLLMNLVVCVLCYKKNPFLSLIICLHHFQSRIVRNVNPTFIWVLKRDIVDYRFLTRDQMVNHYIKAGSFTTKVGQQEVVSIIQSKASK